MGITRLSLLKNILFGSVLFYLPHCHAQDVEPRRWSSLPLGINIVGAGYAYTWGDVFFDPVIGAEDVIYRGNGFVASYVRPFRLGNKLARVDILLPVSFSRWEGRCAGAERPWPPMEPSAHWPLTRGRRFSPRDPAFPSPHRRSRVVRFHGW